MRPYAVVAEVFGHNNADTTDCQGGNLEPVGISLSADCGSSEGPGSRSVCLRILGAANALGAGQRWLMGVPEIHPVLAFLHDFAESHRVGRANSPPAKRKKSNRMYRAFRPPSTLRCLRAPSQNPYSLNVKDIAAMPTAASCLAMNSACLRSISRRRQQPFSRDFFAMTLQWIGKRSLRWSC